MARYFIAKKKDGKPEHICDAQAAHQGTITLCGVSTDQWEQVGYDFDFDGEFDQLCTRCLGAWLKHRGACLVGITIAMP